MGNYGLQGQKMAGKRLRKKNCTIKFDGKEPESKNNVANEFNRTYARACLVTKTNENRLSKQKVRAVPKTDFVTDGMIDLTIPSAKTTARHSDQTDSRHPI